MVGFVYGVPERALPLRYVMERAERTVRTFAVDPVPANDGDDGSTGGGAALFSLWSRRAVAVAIAEAPLGCSLDQFRDGTAVSTLVGALCVS